MVGRGAPQRLDAMLDHLQREALAQAAFVLRMAKCMRTEIRLADQEPRAAPARCTALAAAPARKRMHTRSGRAGQIAAERAHMLRTA